MPETFLILLSAGVMCAAAISNPREVTLQWLRLAGIIALAMAGLSLFFLLWRDGLAGPDIFRRTQIGLWSVTLASIAGQLAFVQVAWRKTQRGLALLAFIAAVLTASGILHELMIVRGSAAQFPPKLFGMILQTLTCAGAAAMTGLVLMDMLLGHAYLTASRMTMTPFRRLNITLGIVMILRIAMATALTMSLHTWKPVYMLWGVHGLLIVTRWMVGLLIPAVFIWMAHDCIRRRSTQSATGILYVTGVLVFIGEIIALHLMRETGLPF